MTLTRYVHGHWLPLGRGKDAWRWRMDGLLLHFKLLDGLGDEE